MDYKTAIPFPHVILDAFKTGNMEACEKEINATTGFEKNAWHTQKKQCYVPDNGECRRIINSLNDAKFLRYLEDLTGISGLIPDPYFDGGGVHKVARGGFLKIHADFNWHKKMKLDRRVNLLLYLNSDWKEEWGGHLELWDGRRCVKKVLPTMGTMVIFNTTDYSFHGHPHPLNCPDGVTRNSIALYYYTNGRPRKERRRGKHLHTLYTELSWWKRLIPSWVYLFRRVR